VPSPADLRSGTVRRTAVSRTAGRRIAVCGTAVLGTPVRGLVPHVSSLEWPTGGRVHAVAATPRPEGLVTVGRCVAPGDLEAEPLAQRLVHEVHADRRKCKAGEAEPGNRIGTYPGPTLTDQEENQPDRSGPDSNGRGWPREQVKARGPVPDPGRPPRKEGGS